MSDSSEVPVQPAAPEAPPEDTQAVFPLPASEIRGGMVLGVLVALDRAVKRLSEAGRLAEILRQEDQSGSLVTDLSRTLVDELFGDLTRDPFQVPRRDDEFLDLQLALNQAVKLDQLVLQLEGIRRRGRQSFALLTTEGVEGDPNGFCTRVAVVETGQPDPVALILDLFDLEAPEQPSQEQAIVNPVPDGPVLN